MSDTLYERYITGDSAISSIFGTTWRAQTFTIGNTGVNENHNITSVKLKLYRYGLPGTITVSIREVDGDEKPTGSDLISGTTNGNTLTTVSPGEWREILLDSTTYNLSVGTKYSIIIRATSGDIDNSIRVRYDHLTSVYTGGAFCYSSDGGVSWNLSASQDMVFEEYGIPTIYASDVILSSQPTATTAAATNVLSTTATLNGTYELNSNPSSNVQFEWGETAGYGNTTTWEWVGGSSYSKGITSLPVSTTHHFRFAVSSIAFPTVYGSDLDFTTTKARNYDLQIYYDSLTGDDYIDCKCSRWDASNYSLTIETWLTKSQLQTLRNNITPGAVGELYKILGEPTYYDKTWEGKNTLKLYSNSGENSNLQNMREEKLVYVKNITTHPIKGPSEWIEVKIECYISGGQNL